MKKIFCFDLDNTISVTKKNDYKNAKPDKKAIRVINALYKKKYIIKIFTSRFMGRNNDDPKKAILQGYRFTEKQLKKWGLNYHKLILGKPSYDYWIDDKSYNYNKKWTVKFTKKFDL